MGDGWAVGWLEALVILSLLCEHFKVGDAACHEDMLWDKDMLW